MRTRRAAFLGTASAILYVFLWSAAFVPSRVLSRAAPPLSVLWIRFLIAGGLLLAGVAIARLPLPRDRKTWLSIALVGVTGNCGYLGATYLAMRHLSAGMGAIIASTNPLILALLAPRLLGEPLTRRKLAGLVLGFSGVVIAMQARAGTQSARPQDVALALLGVLCLVISTLVYKRIRTHPHPLVLNAIQLASAAVFMLPVALIFEGPPRIPWTPALVSALAFLVLVLSVGASMLWFWILRHGEASRVSAFYFLTPVFGLGLGALLLGEHLAPLDGLGLAVICAGLWLAMRR
jgi:drug/metabolite transporter (DMT)-like permease